MTIGRDTTYNLIAALAPGLLTVAVVPFYLHLIGPERFGVLAICWTIMAAIGFASLGMGPALTYRLATLTGEDVRSSLVWTALTIGFSASIAGGVLVVAVGELYFRHFFLASAMLASEIRDALPLLAALAPLTIVVGILNGALQGIGCFGTRSAINVINSALLTLLPLAVAYLISVELASLVLATVVATAAVALIALRACWRLVPLKLPSRLPRSEIKSLLSYGAWMSGTALIAPLVMLVDRFVIGALRGPTAVAVYVLPYNLVQQLVLLPASFTSAVLPRLAALADHEVSQLQSSSLTSLNALLTPLSIAGIALAAPFLHVWIGPTLSTFAAPVAAILLVGGWVHGIGHIPSTFVIARSRPDLLTKLLLAYLAPYLLLLYFATLHFGVVGAAAAWTIRAAFDPVLFLYTRPRRADLLSVAVSAALVIAAMAVALVLQWTSALYWVLLLTVLCCACYIHRRVLISSPGDLARVVREVMRRGNEVAIHDHGI